MFLFRFKDFCESWEFVQLLSSASKNWGGVQGEISCTGEILFVCSGFWYIPLCDKTHRKIHETLQKPVALNFGTKLTENPTACYHIQIS